MGKRCPNCQRALDPLGHVEECGSRKIWISDYLYRCSSCPAGYNRFDVWLQPTEESLELRRG
jgi:hypothetical protein